MFIRIGIHFAANQSDNSYQRSIGLAVRESPKNV